MKNREEYEASIYAKRDALLKKRKKNIQAAVSVICIVFCIGAASLAIPEMKTKIADEQTELTENLTREEITTESKDELFDANGIYDYSESDDIKTGGSADNFGDNNYFAAGSVVQNGISSSLPAENKYNRNDAIDVQTEIALETEIYKENGNKSEVSPTKAPSQNGKPQPTTTVNPSFSDNAETKAIDAAYGYLTDEQKAKVDTDAHKDVTVTRNADGTEYFTVIFHIDEGAYLVSVDSKTFEFVKFNERKSTTQAVSQVTPAYNPNETTTVREG